MRRVAALVLDDERILVALLHESLEELRPVAAVATAEAGKTRLVVEAVPFVGGERNAGLLGQLGLYVLDREETTPVNGLGVGREVARTLDVDAAELLEIHGVDDVARIDVLPDVVRRIVRLLKSTIIIENSVHELAGRETAGEIAVAVGRRDLAPAFHRAVLDANGDAKALGVPENRSEDFFELLEILLETILLIAELHIISDERTADDIVCVAAQKRCDADELKNMVLVLYLLRGIAADEIVVRTYGNAKTRLIADFDHSAGRLGREVIVLEMRRDVVRAVGVAAEYAKLETLCADIERALDDAVEVLLERERRSHEPDRIVAGLGLYITRESTARTERTDSRNGRRRFKEISS